MKFITSRPLWVNILVGLLLAFILFFLFIFSLRWITHHDKSMTVPSVIGKTYEQAKADLEKAGFEVEVQDSVYSDTAKPLRVLKQVPDADEIVKVNRTVYLTVNRAVPPMIDMPNLIGYSFRSAQMALENSGLKLGDTTYRPDFARNAVLEQLANGNPIRAGQKIRMGSSVTLVLGNGVGDRKFPVPNLIGRTYAEAKAMLEANGLGLGSVIADGVSDTANAYIFWQNPERFDVDKKLIYIRSGQMMDIRVQVEKPVTDPLGEETEPMEPENDN